MITEFVSKNLSDFIHSIIEGEKINSLGLITSLNASALLQTLGNKLEDFSVYPEINSFMSPHDIFIILPDINPTAENIGKIKNTLSQKLVIFSTDSQQRDMLLRLGLVNEFDEDLFFCFSYNLKTYNNKRNWNNPEGWANPENFDKYRW